MKSSGHLPAYALILLTAVLMTGLSIAGEGSYGGEDSFMHYLIARFAPAHPELFLDHWGKPLFTILSAPFAAFGFTGIRIFNILCGISTAWLGYKSAVHLKWESAWAVIPMILYNALFFVTCISGLTEPLFALILMSSVYLYLKEKYVLSSLIISFLPFVRSEGNLMILLWAVSLSAEKKWTTLPFVLTGTMVLSIVGGIIKSNVFWLWTENPYQGAADVYGSGDLLHFIRANRETFGVPQTLMAAAGLCALCIGLLRTRSWKDFKIQIPLLLMAGSFTLYLAAHSWFWYKGLYGSAGLIRVMAAVVPMASMMCVLGLNFVMKFLPVPTWIKQACILIILGYVVYDPFFQHKLPYALSERQEIMKKVALWYPDSGCKRVFTAHPYFVYAAGLDNFDPEQRQYLQAAISVPLRETDLIIWDNQFGPNECHLDSNWYEKADIMRFARFESPDRHAVVELYMPKRKENTYLKPDKPELPIN